MVSYFSAPWSLQQERPPMKKFGACVVSACVGGVLIVAPLSLAVVLLLKAMHAVVAVVRPCAMVLPAWFPAAHVLALLLVLLVCFLLGAAVRTPIGRALRGRIETALVDRLPAYALVRSLTYRLAGQEE